MNIQQIIQYYDKFKSRGWIPGGCGAIAHLFSITENSRKIYVTPERPRHTTLTNNDLFLLRHLYGKLDIQNPLNQDEYGLTISKWTNIFLEVFANKPNATCVAQFSTKWSVLGARMALEAWRKNSSHYPNILRLAHWGLLSFLGADRELLIPIIEFSDPDSMQQATKNALELYPQTCAILIRDYGVITWGTSLEDLESRTELLEHIMELEVREFNSKAQN